MALHVAVDTGGTFTDVVATDGTRVVTAKVPSTPDDPSRAVAHGIAEALRALGAEALATVPDLLVHGTTVATNALLERRGACVALVTTAGFEDLLRIGRQHRASLYRLEVEHRPTLVAPEDVMGVEGRLAVDGGEIEPLSLEALTRHVASLDSAPRSWAVCLIHAWASPRHEDAVAELLRALRPDDAVCTSSFVLPVFREVERAQTTVANATVAPRMEAYLGRLLALAAEVEVMGSSGGRLRVAEAAERPVLTALSGPAGGVVAAAGLAGRLGVGVLSVDMGGTSTDVAVVANAGGRADLPVRHAGSVGPWSIHTPMLDIHTVGAGGGSVVWIDDGGALRVGPRSAGADPGPACYGRGDLPTVTDANLLLGHIAADARLGGHVTLDVSRARAAFESIAHTLGATPEDVARGALEIVNATMAGAMRRVSSERGTDPAALVLCAFGGAGPQHACALAEELGMTRVVVPAFAGVLSAWGIAQSERVAERARTVLGLRDWERVLQIADPLVEEARRAVLGDAAASASASLDVEVRVEARYVGQGYELSVPLDRRVERTREAFADLHAERFGYRLDADVEWVTLRVRVAAPSPGLPRPCDDARRERTVGPRTLSTREFSLRVADGWVAERRADGDWYLERVTPRPDEPARAVAPPATRRRAG